MIDENIKSKGTDACEILCLTDIACEILCLTDIACEILCLTDIACEILCLTDIARRPYSQVLTGVVVHCNFQPYMSVSLISVKFRVTVNTELNNSGTA
jgi:hypothetical protein